jgi:hypothetical protein
MKLKGALIAVAVLLTSLVAGAGVAGAAGTATTSTTPYCGITWGSLDKAAGTLSQAPLVTTRTGRHDCYDRVVFEFAGPVNGYAVNYGEAYTQGQGLALSPYTAGGIVLNVVLLAPAYDQSGAATYQHRAGDHVANVLGYRTLRDVVYGGSFEAHSTFAIGVRGRLPFRVFVLSGPDTHSRIVVDVAHQWLS